MGYWMDQPANDFSGSFSDENYWLLIEESPIGIEIYDETGLLRHVNKAWEQIWQANAADVVDKFNPLHVEQMEEKGVLPLIQKAFAGENVEIPDIEFDPAASGLPGRKRWLRSHVYHTKHENGAVKNVVVMTEDITERKEAELKVQTNELKYRSMTERLYLLHEIHRAILSMRSSSEIAVIALDHLCWFVHCKMSNLVLFDYEKEMLFVLAANENGDGAKKSDAAFPLEDFPIDTDFANGENYLMFDLQTAVALPPFMQQYQKAGCKTFISVPLFAYEELIGAINMVWDTPEMLLTENLAFVEDVCNQLAVALQQAHLLAAENQRRREAETLRTVTAAFATTLNLEQLLNLILEQLSHVLDYDSATIFLYENDALRGMACRGIHSPETVLNQLFPVDDDLFLYALQQGEPVCLADAGKDPRFFGWGETQQIRGWMGVPLLAHGHFIGYMTIDSYKANAYDAEDIALVKPFAGQAAQAIENARLYDQVQDHANELESALAKLQETQRQLVQQERLAAVGQMAGGIAHDFNNILAVVVLYSQLLQRTARLTALDATRLQTIVDQANRATQLIQQILDFSRKSLIEKRPLSLLPFLEEMKVLLGRTLPETIQISISSGSGLYDVHADPTSMQQLVMNLAVNARDAMPNGGHLQFILEQVLISSVDQIALPDMHSGHWILIRVKDDGVGMTSDVREKVFEPFFTTKPPGRGTGLGMAQAYGIVRQHEGYITCLSELDVGTEFLIYLPAFTSQLSDTDHSDQATPQGENNLILVVEDSKTALDVIVEILELLNYRVVTAQNGQEAVEQLAANPGIAVVLSDVVMPKMGGFALYKMMQTNYPHVKIIMMSGYAQSHESSPLADWHEVAWIRKPFSIEELAQVIHSVL